MKIKIEKINVKMEKILPSGRNMNNIKSTKNIENIGRGKGGWENPLATRSPIRLQTPYDLAADPLPLLLP